MPMSFEVYLSKGSRSTRSVITQGPMAAGLGSTGRKGCDVFKLVLRFSLVQRFGYRF